MQKKLLLFFTFFYFSLNITAQGPFLDSLNNSLAHSQTNVQKVDALMGIADYYHYRKLDVAAIITLRKALAIANHTNLTEKKVEVIAVLGGIYFNSGPKVNKDTAYQLTDTIVAIAQKAGLYGSEAEQLSYRSGRLNGSNKDSARIVMQNALKLLKDFPDDEKAAMVSWLQSLVYRNQVGDINSALMYANQAVLLAEKSNKPKVKVLTLMNAVENLKSTQAQLIQSEKMASLGKLTAGIAHEIQNPLNFVNNFSDVNKELLEELKEEADKGNIDEVKAIANDVIDNEEKINHHGKRADSIVEGMLQHSQKSTGHKEPTDINKLADEYLRLSYHGMRAKDKHFNAEFKTEFDEAIGKINVVSQDIGRVLLNLFNNAFYAVNEKQKTANENYKPALIVTTKRSSPSPLERGRGEVIITVTDNGSGIPQSIVDKVFQPFFTTKPTGQGTGLGLSLSYDIIKAHGGEIKVQAKEGEGAEFIIQLPVV